MTDYYAQIEEPIPDQMHIWGIDWFLPTRVSADEAIKIKKDVRIMKTYAIRTTYNDAYIKQLNLPDDQIVDARDEGIVNAVNRLNDIIPQGEDLIILNGAIPDKQAEWVHDLRNAIKGHDMYVYTDKYDDTFKPDDCLYVIPAHIRSMITRIDHNLTGILNKNGFKTKIEHEHPSFEKFNDYHLPLDNLKVGVGIVSYNRLDQIKKIVRWVRSCTSEKHELVVADDGSTDGTADWLTHNGIYCIPSNNMGVMSNKNKILRHFREYDYIVILEDDMFPIKDGWLSLMIRVLQTTGHSHFNHVTKRVHRIHTKYLVRGPKYRGFQVLYGQELGAQAAIFDKKCLHMCGGFNEYFKGYGYGHAEYTYRITKAGLTTPWHQFLYVQELENYMREFVVSSATPSDKLIEQSNENYKIFQEVLRDKNYPIKLAL